MTKAADTRGLVPTASVFARGRRESSVLVADGDSVWVLSGDCHRLTRLQSLGATNETASIAHPYRSQSDRSSFIQALIDIGAILAGLVLISLFAVAIAVAIAVPLFVNLKF